MADTSKVIEFIKTLPIEVAKRLEDARRDIKLAYFTSDLVGVTFEKDFVLPSARQVVQGFIDTFDIQLPVPLPSGDLTVIVAPATFRVIKQPYEQIKSNALFQTQLPPEMVKELDASLTAHPIDVNNDGKADIYSPFRMDMDDLPEKYYLQTDMPECDLLARSCTWSLTFYIVPSAKPTQFAELVLPVTIQGK